MKHKILLESGIHYQYRVSLYVSSQLSRDELIQSIHAGIRGSDMGVEVMGYSLIPTYIDLGSNGFPAFLSQAINPSSSTSMIGNSLQQILFLFTQATNPSILSRNHLITGLKKACELASGKNVPKDHGKSLDNWED